MYRYVIIGSGVAGVSAAGAIRSLDKRAEIFLIGDEKEGYYSRPGLAYYLTNEIDETQLFPFTQKEFDQLNIRNIYTRVTAIQPDNHQIVNIDSRSLSYNKLLIATGASAATISLPGISLDGVVKLDNLSDAKKIIKLARKAKHAVVIGGGITALEIVEGLASRKVQVHYLLRGDRYWGNVLDETESRIIEERLQDEGVKIHFNTETAQILEKRGRVNGIETTDKRRIPCEIVAIAIGITPRTHLAVNAGLKTDRGILVNEHMQTSNPDIYAAGDVAQVFDSAIKKYVLDSLWNPARSQGTTAGLNMTGQTKSYPRSVPFNVTRLANLTTTIIGQVGKGIDQDLVGIARGDSEVWRQLPNAIAAQHDHDINRLRIMIGEKTLIGAVVMGNQLLSQPLEDLIVNQVDILPIRDQLLKNPQAIEDIITNHWIYYKEMEKHA